METELRKFNVCSYCFCVGIVDTNCVCSYKEYKEIELEFEVCSCCGHLINDGHPADTEFNEKQLSNNKTLLDIINTDNEPNIIQDMID